MGGKLLMLSKWLILNHAAALSSGINLKAPFPMRKANKMTFLICFTLSNFNQVNEMLWNFYLQCTELYLRLTFLLSAFLFWIIL